MSAAALLAGAAACTDVVSAPPAVRDRVVDLVADCVAVTALGSCREELRRLVEDASAWAGDGSATVVGSSRGWTASEAAFLNGSAVAADQLQDGHRLARGHPASHVVPAVLAVAEERDLGGVDVLSAVLAGYETGARVGRAMGGTPDGVHDIGTWGSVAAAVGVARLLAPGDRAATERALELSASAVLLTDARTVFAGRSGSHAYLGTSVATGLRLGVAAVAGLVAEPGSLERHLAAVAARDWAQDALTSGVDEHGWKRHEVLEGYVKAHPTCAHLHGVNDAVQDLLDAGLHADDVAEVEVRVGAAAAAFGGRADAELAARFSVPTSVAVAMVTGRLDETTLVDATVVSPDVERLASLVRVLHDPALDVGYPAGRPAAVQVQLRDGRRLAARSTRPRGDADRAFDRSTLRAKADRLLRHRFGEPGSRVLALMHALADGGSARELGHGLREACA